MEWFIPMPLVLVLVLVLVLPLVFQFSIRRKTTNSMLCGIITKGKPLKFKLLKIREGEFVREGEDDWIIDDRQVKLINYPSGPMWEVFPMNLFQQTVPCSLYMKGRGDPLDWENPSQGSLSSKELRAILDPHWMETLVKGVAEMGKAGLGKTERILLFLAVGASIICLVLIFILLTKIGSLEQAIQLIR